MNFSISIKEKASVYLLDLWQEQSGGFRFASHQPATLMGTAYAVLALEFLGSLPSIEPDRRSAIVKFIMTGLQKDAFFKDALFDPDRWPKGDFDVAYLTEETTSFCHQALDALDAPLPPRCASIAGATPDSAIRYLGSLSWKDPWLESNRFMFAFSRIAYNAERHGETETLKALDAALDWIDDRRSPETGLWRGPHEVSRVEQLAATVHFIFFHRYRKKPIRYAERIIDTCLTLQMIEGLFNPNGFGHSCFDYDAVDLLVKTAEGTDHRRREVQESLARAASALLTLVNDDGGFADCKVRFSQPLGLKLPRLISKRPARGDYGSPERFLSAKSAQSNGFSTWFRLLALAEASLEHPKSFCFRRLPFLGYHG